MEEDQEVKQSAIQKSTIFNLSMRESVKNSDQDLFRYMQSIPAMFWRIHLVKNRIEFLNDFYLPVLGPQSRQILQNRDYIRLIVLSEDIHQLENFLQAARNRRNKTVIIRVQPGEASLRWLKIVGTSDTENYNFYHGYIMDVSDAVETVLSKESNSDLMHERLFMFEQPVILVEAQSHFVYEMNLQARSFFGFKAFESLKNVNMYSLFYKPDMRQFNAIYEHLLFQESWQGEMTMRRNDESYRSMIKIRTLLADAQYLFWIAILEKPEVIIRERDCEQEDIDPDRRRKFLQIAAEGDMGEILSMLLSMQSEPLLADGILYSHVSRDRSVVRVWGKGNSWKKLNNGAAYAFNGTIAENIETYELPYLIVEETMESIKPIDWALFIPHNVHSYLSIPLFEEEEMHTILIFTSEQPGRFQEKHFYAMKCYSRLFAEALSVWKARFGDPDNVDW